ncbi:MAG: Adenine specific methyltransferase [Ignavibacteria bacterium]|nr:Adenine specific methyltransferase [Ignavibacteria bacterium]
MFQTYFNDIQKNFLSDNESSELTYRPALDNLLKAFEKENFKGKFNVKHEPKKQEDKGRPDFKVTTKEQLTIGFIETKKIGEDLAKTLQSKQLSNYQQLSDNIIVTDYLHFYLIRKGEKVLDVPLFSDFNLQNKRFKVDKTRIEELSRLLKDFFQSEPESIFKTKDLALRLSVKAIFLKKYCFENLKYNQDEDNLLLGLFIGFKESILHQIDEKDFADIYAQTITYSLFLAALNCDSPKIQLNQTTAFSLLPKSFPLIKELFHRLDDFPSDIIWSIEEIISILKVTDFTAIKKEFAEYRHKEQGFNDPFIFFYEDFLKHYDKSQRELRGVYYTPEPVVSFIVRSIEVILKEKFLINDGFINKDVTLLDFAAGTGTFLLHAIKQAIEQALKLGDKQTVNKILNEQVLNNFYGFELLVAPYVIANLKISEYLKDEGYSLDAEKRLNIYLTNTLTNELPKPIPGLPSISKEGRLASETKSKPILVILGNPPYSGHSANKGIIEKNIKKGGEYISHFKLSYDKNGKVYPEPIKKIAKKNMMVKEMTEFSGQMAYYKIVDGKSIDEKNPKWLQDDYVKFIRFAQWKMEKVERGIVGIISNHSYLDNPTFRGMRQSLMTTFDEIYILDLHGNAKKKEKCPDGSKDENVFDIMQGVSIALFIKKDNKPKNCKVFHFDLFGLRLNKYQALFDLSLKNVNWEQINPNSPFYLFKIRDEKLLKKYNKGLSLRKIFKHSSVGIVTSRDDFVIDTSLDKLKKRIYEFKNLSISNHDIEIKYNLKENLKFKIDKSRKIIHSFSREEIENKICKIHYRPFDVRFLFYDDSLIERMRKDIMINMQEENIALISMRQFSYSGDYTYSLISDCIFDNRAFVSSRGISYIFPLYILSNGVSKSFFGVKEPEIKYNAGNNTNSALNKTDNFTPEFRKFINSKYQDHYTPEQILGYIYAVLHSPTYRTKYIEFLKIDFPRIPFTDDENKYQELSKIGEKLINAHLMKEIPTGITCPLLGGGNNFKVESVNFDKGKVWFNKERYFDNVPVEVWNFYIGGYQVLEKWLKERKKHEIILNPDDFGHFRDMVNIISYTIKTMQYVDEITKDWI